MAHSRPLAPEALYYQQMPSYSMPPLATTPGGASWIPTQAYPSQSYQLHSQVPQYVEVPQSVPQGFMQYPSVSVMPDLQYSYGRPAWPERGQPMLESVEALRYAYPDAGAGLARPVPMKPLYPGVHGAAVGSHGLHPFASKREIKVPVRSRNALPSQLMSNVQPVAVAEIRAMARFVVHTSIAQGHVPVFGQKAVELLKTEGPKRHPQSEIVSQWIDILSKSNACVIPTTQGGKSKRENLSAVHQLNVKISEYWSYKAKRLKKDLVNGAQSPKELRAEDLTTPAIVRALATWSNVPPKDLTIPMVTLGVWRGNKLLAGKTLRDDIQEHRESGSHQRRHAEFSRARLSWQEEIDATREALFPGGRRTDLDAGIARLAAKRASRAANGVEEEERKASPARSPSVSEPERPGRDLNSSQHAADSQDSKGRM